MRAACASCLWAPPRTSPWPSRRARRSCESARGCTLRVQGCGSLPKAHGGRNARHVQGKARSPRKRPLPMAFRDSWHRALVYFGLAEEYHDDYEEPPHEEEIADRYRERPNVRRLSPRRRRDEFDDIYAEDDRPESRGRPTTVLRPVGRGNGDVRVHLV